LKLKAIEAEFRGKVSFHEEQAKTLRTKVEDFSLREVLYFIEIERLHSIGSELMQDIEQLNKESDRTVSENNRSKQIIEVSETFLLEFIIIKEMTKAQIQYQKEHASRMKLEELIKDLRQQVDEYEARAQRLPNEEIKKSPFSYFKSQDSDTFKSPTESMRSSFIEKRLTVSHNESVKKVQVDVTDLTQKFETDKNSMESQLNQLKKIIEDKKREIKAEPETTTENNTSLKVNKSTLNFPFVS